MSSALTAPLSAVIYGPAGSGKTTDLCEAFPNALFLLTKRTVTRPYYSRIRDQASAQFAAGYDDFLRGHKLARDTLMTLPEATRRVAHDEATDAGLHAAALALGRRYPLREIVTPEYQPDGITKVGAWASIRQLGAAFCSEVAAGADYEGIVLDEWTEWQRRIYSDMDGQFKSRKGVEDEFARMDALEALVLWVLSIATTTERSVVLNSAESAPVYHDKEGPPSAPKYRGGPEAPFGRLRERLTTSPDVVLRTTLRDLPRGGGLAALGKPTEAAPTTFVERRYWTEANTVYATKFRDFGIRPDEPIGLRALFVRAGYLPG